MCMSLGSLTRRNFSDPHAVSMMTIWPTRTRPPRRASERGSQAQAAHPRRRDGLVCGRKLTKSKLTLTPAKQFIQVCTLNSVTLMLLRIRSHRLSRLSCLRSHGNARGPYTMYM
jgi:hypothetical protein